MLEKKIRRSIFCWGRRAIPEAPFKQMCCAAAGIFTCIIVIINTILGTGFLVMVVFGILLRFLLPFVKSAIETVFTHLGLSIEEKTMGVEFLQLRSSA
ncbi:hypothetical protein TSMEX_002792, partial [Taenia solium]